MFKKAMISLAGLVIFSTIIIAAFAMSNNNDTNNQQDQRMITSDTALNTIPESVGYKSTNYHVVSNVKHKILTPQEVQKIAENYIKAPEATAGIPKLVKQDGKKVYVVPVVDHKQNVGEISIDAYSGKNLGGAGGVK
jgi:uncharacterized membrane protein YkoI